MIIDADLDLPKPIINEESSRIITEQIKVSLKSTVIYEMLNEISEGGE